MEPIIQVNNLTMAHGEHELMRDLTFSVHPGEIFVILGGSGCGKSTLMRHLIGLQSPTTGEIFIEGSELTTANATERQNILKKFGVMYQSGALFGSMTLLENVCVPLEEHTKLPPDAIEAIARQKLQLVGLGSFAHHLPAEISGGMQKRAGIARAMALDPKILFLDEPSAGLDPITSTELDQLITELARLLGITFVMVSHELSSIFSIANRVIMLDKITQSIVAEGDPKQLRAHCDNEWVKQFLNRDLVDENH
ncbi:MAG: ABC transporter ATP-binding protein [marine bacterium B5-7]|nr:MAG: ABC transporter ATP-binding protein [marine bacterium B5-7]